MYLTRLHRYLIAAIAVGSFALPATGSAEESSGSAQSVVNGAAETAEAASFEEQLMQDLEQAETLLNGIRGRLRDSTCEPVGGGTPGPRR